MERNKFVKKSSSIYKVDAYIDGNGLLRVGGQLNQSTMDASTCKCQASPINTKR